MSNTIDRVIQVIDNHNGSDFDPKFDIIDPLDTVVVKVLDGKGGWSFKGMTAGDFVLNLEQSDFTKGLRTPQERIAWLGRVSGKMTAPMSTFEREAGLDFYLGLTEANRENLSGGARNFTSPSP